MPYESPKQIRRRQNAANDRAARRPHKPSPIKVMTDEEWAEFCDMHLACLHDCAGFPDAAGRHAETMVSMAVYRRATEIMRDHGRAYSKAMAIARQELYDCEVA